MKAILLAAILFLSCTSVWAQTPALKVEFLAGQNVDYELNGSLRITNIGPSAVQFPLLQAHPFYLVTDRPDIVLKLNTSLDRGSDSMTTLQPGASMEQPVSASIRHAKSDPPVIDQRSFRIGFRHSADSPVAWSESILFSPPPTLKIGYVYEPMGNNTFGAVRITNAGSAPVQFPGLQSSDNHWYSFSTDDPAVNLDIGFVPWSGFAPPQRTITLQPGESFDRPANIQINSGRIGQPITYRIGFKAAQPPFYATYRTSWSEPITYVEDQKAKDLIAENNPMLQMSASMIDPGTVHIVLRNASSDVQTIRGSETQIHTPEFIDDYVDPNFPWDFAPIITDSRTAGIPTGISRPPTSTCNAFFRKYNMLKLKPGEEWKSDCTVGIGRQKPGVRQVTFRVGMIAPDQLPIWSNEVTVDAPSVQPPLGDNGVSGP